MEIDRQLFDKLLKLRLCLLKRTVEIRDLVLKQLEPILLLVQLSGKPGNGPSCRRIKAAVRFRDCRARTPEFQSVQGL
jgi:hypothetical protein